MIDLSILSGNKTFNIRVDKAPVYCFKWKWFSKVQDRKVVYPFYEWNGYFQVQYYVIFPTYSVVGMIAFVILFLQSSEITTQIHCYSYLSNETSAAMFYHNTTTRMYPCTLESHCACLPHDQTLFVAQKNLTKGNSFFLQMIEILILNWSTPWTN